MEQALTMAEHWSQVLENLPQALRDICQHSVKVEVTDDGLEIIVSNAFLLGILSQKLDIIRGEFAKIGVPAVKIKVILDESAAPPDRKDDTNHSQVGPRPVKEPRYLLKLRPELTFATLVVGTSNELAYRAAQDVAKWNQRGPVILIGGSGSGKTHLMQAIAQEARINNPEAKIVYVPTQALMEHHRRTARSRLDSEWKKFEEKYQLADLLLLDDLHFLDKFDWTKTRLQLRFILEELVARNALVVLASIRSVETFHDLDSELKSRLRAMRSIRIHPPDYDMRTKIFLGQAARAGLNLTPELALKAVERISLDIRAINGAVSRLKDWVELLERVADEEAIRKLFGDEPTNARVTFDTVIETVARFYGTTSRELTSPGDKFASAKQVAVFLCHEMLGMDLYELAEDFQLEAARIASIVRTIQQKNSLLREDVEQLRKDLHGAPNDE